MLIKTFYTREQDAPRAKDINCCGFLNRWPPTILPDEIGIIFAIEPRGEVIIVPFNIKTHVVYGDKTDWDIVVTVTFSMGGTRYFETSCFTEPLFELED